MSLYNELIQPAPGESKGRRRQRLRRGISLWQPYSWPRAWRRIALLTLPLAAILWLAAALFVGLRAAWLDARKPLRRFWNAPSRRRGGYGYFSY